MNWVTSPRCGVVPKFSDMEEIALNLIAEDMIIDSESYLFALQEKYKGRMPFFAPFAVRKNQKSKPRLM